ncbi:hypothetical protein Tco_0720028 [Tanacetum coccineum]
MANLKYSDKHNMVAFLKKPNKSVGFTEFWQTATVKTLANGTQQFVASIDSKEYTITKAYVRSKLQLADAIGIHNLSDAEIYAGLATLGPKSGGWDQFGSTVATALIYLSSNRVQLWIKVKDQHNQLNPIPHLLIHYHPHPYHIFHHHLLNSHHINHHLTYHFNHHLTYLINHPPHHTCTHYLAYHIVYDGHSPEGNIPGSAEDSVQLKELMVLVPNLVNRVTSLEKELKETKQTLGNVVLTLVKKVKTLEVALKRKSKKVIVSESEGEEPEDQGRIIQDIDDDPLVSLVRESMKEKSTDFVTPTKALGEAQEEEEISPTILEAAKTLSKVASQSVSKAKSTDKGKRYRRRARSMAKKINTGLDAEDEINTGRVEINTGIEDVNTGSTKVDSGRREGKAQMVEEDIQATHKTKEQIRQEEAGLEEAIRLQAQMDEEVAKQIHLDKMLAKRVQEEQELSEQQLKRKVEVQKAAQFYTEEDWDTIREKLEANTEVVKSLQGESISNDDFAKRMVEMINEKKKFYAEQKAKAKRSKPMTQAQQREYMSTFIKNQSSWKLSQLKKLSFEELKTEFEKLMKSIESFVPMETEARVKRHGLQLEQETSKKQKIDIEDASITKGKEGVKVVKEKKLKVRKKNRNEKEAKGKKGIIIYKITDEINKEKRSYVKDKVKDASSNQDCSRCYSNSYDGCNLQFATSQKIIIGGYDPTCAVHCLTLDASTIYMLADRKYPLSKDACQVMLKMKLLDGIMDEVGYQLLKMIEKQAGIRK